MADLVSVIIPTYNRRKDLCVCIDSIMNQEYKPIEIIVVDDCSQDDTIEYLSSHYKDITVIKSNCHYGPSHLRNKGLIEAKGKYILFLDSDVVLHDEHIVDRMVKKFTEDGNTGQIGGEIPINLGVEDAAYGRRIDFLGYTHQVPSNKPVTEYSIVKQCDYLCTCNCMVLKDVADVIGGFDPYYGFGGEDVDFGYRIKQKGYINLVDYTVAVYHKHASTGRLRDESYKYKLTRVRFIIKHFSPLRVLTIFFRDFFIVLLFYILLFPKIVIKIVAGNQLKSGNFLGGYHILKAYFVNIVKYSETKRTRNLNFLHREEIDKYETHIKLNSL